jgi:Mg-chelatase subunit ChlD
MKLGDRVIIDYFYKSFELPVTLYQQTIDQTKALPVAYQKPLKDQAEILYSILSELNQWNNLLLTTAAEKQLTKDSLHYAYSVIKRYKELIETFDERKEGLVNDIQSIYETYKPVNPKSSWVVSGKALQALLDEDRKELFKAKRFSLGDSATRANTTEIEKMVRDLVSNEFTNLAGIAKLGRYNGNCPYSPYEDMTQNSKQFIEYLDKVYLRKSVSAYHRHPYNEVLHQYNQNLIYQYNKFAKLSKVPLLKAVEQMQLFEIVAPEKPQPKQINEPVTTTELTPEVVPQTKSDENKTDSSPSAKKKEKKSKPVAVTEQPVIGGIVQDTVRITDIIRIETVRQDTVYISKVDTVYMGMNDLTMSMEGYATNNMVLLLDVSGSMNTPDKLPLLKKSVLLLLKMMRAEDEVSIVTYSGKAKVELQPTSFTEESKITKVIQRLKSEGTTDGNAGIELAYEVADKNYIRGGNNRIIVATDGEFPISKETFELVKKFSGEDIFITVFNFGKTTLSAKNLKQLASLGKGNYEYVTRENVDMKLITEAKAKKKK